MAAVAVGQEVWGGREGGAGSRTDRPISHYCEQQGLIDEGWCW